MLRLDVPFVLEGDYPGFLADNLDRLASVHFSLHDRDLPDARQRMQARELDEIIAGLKRLGTVPKYVLMNSRLHDPDACFDEDRLARIARRLERLVREVSLDGVVFADPYFLQALADGHPGIASQLEAVPSINCMLDSPDRVFSLFAMVGQTGFRPPSRIVLDRSLNRNMARLAETCGRLREEYPDLRIHLMANEGCLYQCPYKPAHDALVAMTNEGLCRERTFALNHDFGCVRRLLDEPGLMLASPFIRPEDAPRYEGHINGIKLCGRTKGADFLKRAVTAWRDGHYDGNLLDLMDAMGDLADRITIPNAELGDDFYERVTGCDKNCRSCGWCATLFERVGGRIDPGLARL